MTLSGDMAESLAFEASDRAVSAVFVSEAHVANVDQPRGVPLVSHFDCCGFSPVTVESVYHFRRAVDLVLQIFA